VEEIPPVAPTCSLGAAGLREQLARYRTAGQAAEVLECDKRRRVIRAAASVPDSVIERLVEVERDCCPFFDLSWDPHDRLLTISISDDRYQPALDAIGHALGVEASTSR
jgi:hypothetical protein